MKTILITGSGSGIGRDTAIVLAQRGHSVIATTRTKASASELAAYAKQHGVTLRTFALDVTNAKDREKIAALDIDVLINNAGVGESGSLAEVPLERVRKTFEVNLFGALALTQIALKKMIAKNRGTVLFVSSLAGRTTIPFLAPYSMTKHALSNGAESLREELKKVTKHVHVSVIEPGAYATGFNQRMIETKFSWMGKQSYFSKIASQLRETELRRFAALESKTTDSIVKAIVQAVESNRPKRRYVAPWWQGLGVRLSQLWR